MYKGRLWAEHSWMDVASGELTAVEGRRRRSAEERRLIVEETLEPGASVARVARKHGVNANQVFAWRRLYEQGRLSTSGSALTLLPVSVAEEPVTVQEHPVAAVPAPSGAIHIELPGRALISLEGHIDPAMIRAVLKGLVA
jgi:transposase